MAGAGCACRRVHLIAVLTLVIGIGANTAIFTLVQGILSAVVAGCRPFAPLSHRRPH